MKKKALLVLFTILGLHAMAVEDTTWVQVYAKKMLDNYNNFDTAVQFPDGAKSYRKIYMIFTLGKYACPGYDPNNAGDQPGQTGWCGDWDYTVQNFVMTPAGDTLEVGRLITPYTRQNGQRTPLSWTQRYVYDVTDYYPLLKNNATFRLHYSGYSGGFTANVKFAFVAGTPERNVAGVKTLWHGDFAYGKTSDPIESHVNAVSGTAPATTQSAELKFNVTGHGSDNTECSEFCKKYYKVLVNGNSISQTDIWRDNCGSNELYPQTGTWVYQRGNWCPGAQVQTNSHVLTGVTANSNYNVDVDFQAYTGNGSASYTVAAALVYYQGFNHQLDASIESIVAPTDFEGHYRENPICGHPVVTVRNSGSTPITAINFTYGIQGGAMAQYSWTGTLASLATTDIVLPVLDDLNTVDTNATEVFVAQISQVNGQADENADNNQMTATFKGAPNWSPDLIVTMHTNTFASDNETTWALYDMDDHVVAQCNSTHSNTTYTDTLHIGPGCYKFSVMDAGGDGLDWWANAAAGHGTLKITTTKSALPLTLNGYFKADFGSGFTQYFHADWPVGVQNINAYPYSAMEAYPNPVKNIVNISLAGVDNMQGTIQIIDITGRKVIEQTCNSANTEVDMRALPGGIYTAIFINNTGGVKLQARLVKAL